ncbi:MAG: hypothetical protein JNL60_00480 [Bacteroidia bacterium]|nr:hypothetical protein [Bacteroidia bacterium]
MASTQESDSSSPQTASAPMAGPVMAAKPANGVYMPGDEELNAIKPKYNDVNLETLKRGYGIYQGQCRDCHEAKNIYQYTEMEWNQIMTDMAMRAHLDEAQKTAVWQYVMAVKAVKDKK